MNLSFQKCKNMLCSIKTQGKWQKFITPPLQQNLKKGIQCNVAIKFIFQKSKNMLSSIKTQGLVANETSNPRFWFPIRCP